jgi:CDP-4-dehydro-6-deoxyglucose reductase
VASGRIVELLEARSLSPSVKAFTFACADGQPLDFIPGQWLNFDLTTAAGIVRRAYSIASAPNREHPERFEIAVTRVDDGGGASRALHALEPHAQVQVDGPHGFFTRERAHDVPALFVGTGTGVCPLRAMIEHELREPAGPQLALLFGCRTEADILWRDELEACAREGSRFSLHVTLSRPSSSWSGLRGYVQTHVVALARATQPHVYVCGLNKMVADVRRVLKQELGYDRRLIHSERYD